MGQPEALPLSWAHVELPPAVKSPALLINARYGVVPYQASDSIRTSLGEWVSGPAGFAARVIAGDGGLGKTRLAVEEAHQLTGEGWVSGFLLPTFSSGELTALAELDDPRLVVVDYAETRARDLDRLMPRLAKGASQRAPVRVLLLMRRPDGSVSSEGDEWLEVLRGHGPELAALSQEMDVVTLEAQAWADDERRSLFDAASTAFAQRLALDPPRATSEDSQLGDSPLVVTLQALLTVFDGEAPRHTNSVLDETLRHEEKYWSAHADSEHVRFPDTTSMRRVVALATLVGAASQAEATAALAELDEYMDESSANLVAAARWAHTLYPGQGYWSPLEPDRVGERLIVRELGKDDCLSRLIDLDASGRVTNVLARIDWLEAPAAESAMLTTLGTLDQAQIVSLALNIDRVSSPDTVAARLLDLKVRGHAGEYISTSLARSRRLSFDVIAAALDRAVVPRSRDAHPWRWKDIPSARWRVTPLGEVLSDLTTSRPEGLTRLLRGWLDDTTPFETTDVLSRQDVASAFLVSEVTFAQSMYDELAHSKPKLLRQIVQLAAELRPVPFQGICERWVLSDDDSLRYACLASALGLISSGEAEARELGEELLALLYRMQWPGSAESLRYLSRQEGRRASVAEAIFAGFDRGELSLDALWPYRESAPGAVVDRLERQTMTLENGQDILILLADWFPEEANIEARLVALATRAYVLAELRYRVARMVESALYRLRDDKGRVSDGRLELARQIFLGGEEDAVKCIIYGLNEKSDNPDFNEFRRSLIEDWRAQSIDIQTIGHIIGGMVGRQTPDWPSADVLEPLLVGLDSEQVSDALLAAVRVNAFGTVPGRICSIVLPLEVSPDERFRTFCTTYNHTHDVFAALDAVTPDPMSGGEAGQN